MNLLALTGALLATATPLRLAAPSLQAVGVDPKKASAFTDYFGQQLSQYGIRVTTSSEVDAILGHERQKQMLGCSEESSSCVAEMAGALGVDGIVSGNVARLEPSGYLMTLKVIAASSGATMGNYSGRLPDENAALDWLARTARQFAVSRGLVVPEGVRLRGRTWMPGAAALVLAGVGTYLYVDSVNVAASLRAGNGTPPERLDATIDAARTQQAVGGALLGAGVAAAATAAVFFLTGDEVQRPPVAVAVIPFERGGYASVSWRFP